MFGKFRYFAHHETQDQSAMFYRELNKNTKELLSFTVDFTFNIHQSARTCCPRTIVRLPGLVDGLSPEGSAFSMLGTVLGTLWKDVQLIEVN